MKGSILAASWIEFVRGSILAQSWKKFVLEALDESLKTVLASFKSALGFFLSLVRGGALAGGGNEPSHPPSGTFSVRP